ncbi:MAG: hypothetical protein OXE99_05130 [Cellvibrionales bacterium]|nr:hypothetical protein [Cellvibrionales bacterium]
MIRVASVVVFLCALQITGCSNFKVANSHLIKAEAYRKVKTENISAVEAIYQATDKLNEAKKTDLEFYSPLHLKQAEEKIARANSLMRLRTSKRSRLSAATTAIEAVKIIEAAGENKKKVEAILADVLAQKAVLDSMDIDGSMSENYQLGLQKISQLVRLVEQDKVERLSVLQPQVMSYLNRLEAKLTKASALAKTKEMLLKAKGIQAQRYAKATYLSAVETYKQAVVYIDTHYKDKAAVADKADDALLAASHAFFVALESQKIVQSDAATIEQYILEVQAHLSHINQQLGIDNLLNYSFKKQAELIHDAIQLKSKFSEKAPEAAPAIADTQDTLPIEETMQAGEAIAKPVKVAVKVEQAPVDQAQTAEVVDREPVQAPEAVVESTETVKAEPTPKADIQHSERQEAPNVQANVATPVTEPSSDPIPVDKETEATQSLPITEPTTQTPAIIDEMKVVTKTID